MSIFPILAVAVNRIARRLGSHPKARKLLLGTVSGLFVHLPVRQCFSISYWRSGQSFLEIGAGPGVTLFLVLTKVSDPPCFLTAGFLNGATRLVMVWRTIN